MIATAIARESIAATETPWQPVHRSTWQFRQIKSCYDINLGKMLQNEAKSSEDVEVPYFKAQHVQWDRVIIDDLPTMWASPWEVKSLRVEQGDLLVCEGGEVGRASLIDRKPPKNCIIQNALHLVRSKNGNDTNFLKYLLQHAASLKWFEVLCNRATIAHFTVEKFSQMWIWLPSPVLQRQIADYLDRETAEIDALIAAKQRLLGLLGEKRRAMITQAVTRGLDANAPIKRLELGWLQTIPKHWNIEHLKYHLFGIEQGWSPLSDSFPADVDEWGVLKVGAVNGWEFNPNENKRIPIELEPKLEYEIKPGDLLVSRANTTELVGSAALVKAVRPKLMLCDKLFRLKMHRDRLDPEFLVFYLRSLSGRFIFERDASGASSSMQNISQETLSNLWIPLPPINEQSSIVNHLKRQLSRLNLLEGTAQKAIQLLKERRISLISAAVTGQIQIPI